MAIDSKKYKERGGERGEKGGGGGGRETFKPQNGVYKWYKK